MTDPAAILSAMHTYIVTDLHQTDQEALSQAGIDLSIGVIDHDRKVMDWAGAAQPVFIVQNDTLSETEGDFSGIGGQSLRPEKSITRQYTQHQFSYATAPLTCYLFTDGFIDQFGGPNAEKYNLPRWRELLHSCQPTSLPNQKALFEIAFQDWKNNTDQIDDVLVLAFRLS